LHCLEQSGLGFGGRTVDFVGEQNVGEHGAFDKSKTASTMFVFVEDVGAGDVGRHQVGRELNPLEFEIEDLCQGAHHQRLGQAGYAFEEAVSTGKDRSKNLLDHLALTNDHLLQFLLHDLAVLLEFFEDISEVASFGGQSAILHWSLGTHYFAKGNASIL